MGIKIASNIVLVDMTLTGVDGKISTGDFTGGQWFLLWFGHFIVRCSNVIRDIRSLCYFIGIVGGSFLVLE